MCQFASSDWLDGEQRDAQQKRNCSDAFLLSDLQRDVAEEAFAAGSTAEQMSEWVLSGFGPGLSRLRSTDVYREAMHARHLNPATRWRPNDLTDLLRLSCAAAYADVVAGEGHMAEILRQARARLAGAQEAPQRCPGRRGAAACEARRGRRGDPTALSLPAGWAATASATGSCWPRSTPPCPGRQRASPARERFVRVGELGRRPVELHRLRVLQPSPLSMSGTRRACSR